MPNRDRGPAEKGSRKCLQDAVRDNVVALNEQIICASPSLLIFNPKSIEWISPRADRDYLEYRDDFLDVLELSSLSPKLRLFWPKGGPQWDGLATLRGAGGERGLLFVEAKAHPEEMCSDCGASPESRKLIEQSLKRVQAHMGGREREWTAKYYQLANRLAYLFFMNVEAGIPAWLALINFVEDQSYKATTLRAWREHFVEVFSWLGVSDRAALLEKVILVFPKGA